ncbi:MAG TPA: hypothetical protein VL096_02600 [Pirellulaceae bacterium]|nr:hypothetical protein [Pirellulaceae bacterium]
MPQKLECVGVIECAPGIACERLVVEEQPTAPRWQSAHSSDMTVTLLTANLAELKRELHIHWAALRAQLPRRDNHSRDDTR